MGWGHNGDRRKCCVRSIRMHTDYRENTDYSPSFVKRSDAVINR